VVLLGGLVVASAANTANLLDLRPGRCAKVFLPLWVVGCLVDPGGGAWSAGLAGAALAALPFDLREEGMLGDAGANALGAVVGTLLLAGPMWLVWAAAVVLLALQLASERVSFTRVIESNRVLPFVLRWHPGGPADGRVARGRSTRSPRWAQGGQAPWRSTSL
jgi:UDP-N-acetylmuramyl pentapeptide phosphotransferase/UDP-N-acetylglucosamine-1-phosphate transferase